VNAIACTRMYDVTPEVRGHWHALIALAAEDAGVALECIDHAAPAPLEALWNRDDLGAAFMCGLPLATLYRAVRPLAAPLTLLAHGGSPTYRSVWLVRADSAFDALAATFGHRVGWTAVHSHSGCNAPRHALLAHRTKARPRLFRESVGRLGHPRAALEALAENRIDVVALDAYWWLLLARFDPATATRFRAIGETEDAPMPPLICGADYPQAAATRLAAALKALRVDPLALPHLEALGVRGFAPVAHADYAVLAEMERAAHAAGYPAPA
jgi:ABC-type phosphate/phosphonate transport system substrate-binding protein